MSVGSSELVLYIDNTGELYPQRRAILKSLATKKRKGVYDAELGKRAFLRLVTAGAKRYVKELRIDQPWNRAFTVADRDEAAADYERHFRSSYANGELEYLLPESLKRAPRKPSKKKKTTKGKSKKKATHRKITRPTKRCPVGTEVQSLVFPKSIFSERQAKDWARRHGYRVSKWDETTESYRIRQKDPKRFRPGSFRTIHLGDVAAVIGCPKS